MAGFVARQLTRSLRLHPGIARQLSNSVQPQCNQRLHNDMHPNVLKSDYPDIVVPEMPLHEFMFDQIAQYGKKICIVSNYFSFLFLHS